MSDEPSPSSYAPFIALALVLILFVLALVGALLTAVIIFALGQAAPHPAAVPGGALNRLAVIAGEQIYTIDPAGANRVELAHNGHVPTAAVIWSHDGQRLIFAESEGGRTRLSSTRPDGQETRVLYEAGRTREPFYLYGAPDDRHVAFLVSDAAAGMQQH